jgi:hypothetical protein
MKSRDSLQFARNRLEAIRAGRSRPIRETHVPVSCCGRRDFLSAPLLSPFTAERTRPWRRNPPLWRVRDDVTRGRRDAKRRSSPQPPPFAGPPAQLQAGSRQRLCRRRREADGEAEAEASREARAAGNCEVEGQAAREAQAQGRCERRHAVRREVRFGPGHPGTAARRRERLPAPRADDKPGRPLARHTRGADRSGVARDGRPGGRRGGPGRRVARDQGAARRHAPRSAALVPVPQRPRRSP